jgi:PAS domain S-box-containing protein
MLLSSVGTMGYSGLSQAFMVNAGANLVTSLGFVHGALDSYLSHEPPTAPLAEFLRPQAEHIQVIREARIFSPDLAQAEMRFQQAMTRLEGVIAEPPITISPDETREISGIISGALNLLGGSLPVSDPTQTSIDSAELFLEGVSKEFTAFMELAADAIVLSDHRGLITSWNPAAERMFGYSSEEVLGKSIAILMPERFREGYREGMRHITQGREHDSMGETMEVLGLRKDSTEFPVSLSHSSWRSAGQRFFAAFVRDITERKLAEDQILQQAHEMTVTASRIRCLFDVSLLMAEPEISLPEFFQGVADIIPLSWQYPKITAARISFNGTAYTTDNWTESQWVQSTNIAIDGVDVGHIEVAYLEERPELAEGPFLQEERDLIEGIARQLENFIQRENLVKQLRQAEKMAAVGNLAAGIGHDFNNYLMSIGNNADLAKDKTTEPKVRSHIEKIRSAADMAVAMVRSLLDFSRPADFKFRTADLSEALDFVEEQLIQHPSYMNGEIELDIETKEGCFAVIDIGKIEQALINLGNNALDAVGSSGRIQIKVERVTLSEGPHIRITVEDNGRGMTPEVQERIFEPFFSTRKDQGGTGLGLAMVYSIINAHKGDISVTSEPGQGATFTILIPASETIRPEVTAEEEES